MTNMNIACFASRQSQDMGKGSEVG
jgi:hypothetical protein